MNIAIHPQREMLMQMFREIGGRWSAITGIYRSFGNTLNANDMKAMKGKVYEYLVQNSLPTLEHVDQPGYDLLCRETGVKIEIKSSHDLLLTRNGRELKRNITFRFRNSNGSNRMELTEENTADLYILLQQDAIAITTRENVLSNITGSGDLTAKIPKESVELLYQSPEPVQLPENPVVNLPEIIKKIMRCVTVGIWNGSDIREQLKECLHQIADDL
jgi:hypothetical protein